MLEDAIAGRRVDGGRRGQHMAAYDWRRGEQRVACKSCGLTWDAARRYWMARFAAIKPAGADGAYDELLLALYTPRGVHVYRHDGQLGLSSNGKSTAATGWKIQICGPTSEESWRSALDEAILPKLDAGGCVRVAEVMW